MAKRKHPQTQCDAVIVGGNWTHCSRSLVGCLRTCPLRPDPEDAEKARLDLLARVPLYQRQFHPGEE